MQASKSLENISLEIQIVHFILKLEVECYLQASLTGKENSSKVSFHPAMSFKELAYISDLEVNYGSFIVVHLMSF